MVLVLKKARGLKRPKPIPPGSCCEAMKTVLSQERDTSRTGFVVPFAFDMGTSKSRPPAIMYTPTGRKAPMWLLNYCPFCGTKLNPEVS
jgi:hypothetical protein